ncbi:BnaC05g32530D [Brassica napus]|uniref:BnaC05g32530D protein n=2 Tax=Brassica napus TaxID=3708 RepID=A0A078GH11_BRANA|nr:BnaC05g32530D [Brassica napus]
MGTFRQDFVSAIRGLAHIVSTLEIGCLVKPSVFEQYNRELKKLEENLGSVKDVSEAYGFAREAIESEILPLWKSLFETNSEVLKLDKTIISELIRPLLNELNKEICARSLASLVIKPGK